MKNFRNYPAEKYGGPDFREVEEGIYRTKCPYRTMLGKEEIFVTSLCFEMEPERYGEEDASPQNITQVPMEGLLDEFGLFVTDFYDALNNTSGQVCYQEFGSFDPADLRRLRGLIGRKFYAVPYVDEKDGEEYYRMVTE